MESERGVSSVYLTVRAGVEEVTCRGGGNEGDGQDVGDMITKHANISLCEPNVLTFKGCD